MDTTQDEDDFRRTMMGFDGEDEVAAAAAASGAGGGAGAEAGAAAPEDGGDPMEVDSTAAGTKFVGKQTAVFLFLL